MKTKILLTILTLAIFASLAFAQADSCNMSLVDEWTTELTFSTGALSMHIDRYGNYIYATLKDRIIVLEIDSSGNLTAIDSVGLIVADVAVIDSYLLVITTDDLHLPDSSFMIVYEISDSGYLDSVTTFSYDVGYDANWTVVEVDDSLVANYCKNGTGVILNLSDPTSPVFVTSFSFPYSASGIAVDYPYIYGGGQYMRGTPPWEDWDNGIIYILDASDPDSIFLSYEGWTEHGSRDHWSSITAMAIKDSILYTAGRNHLVESYAISEDASNAEYITSWYDPDSIIYPNTPHSLIVKENILFLSSLYVCAFDISSPESFEMIGFYKRQFATDDSGTPFFDICVKDSFIIGVGKRGDTIRITSIKYPPEGISGNCELMDIPENFKLETAPNPFNSHCEIKYSLLETNRNDANLSIFDVSGRNVLSQELDAGSQSLIWDASDEASGVYLVVLRAGDMKITKKLIYLG